MRSYRFLVGGKVQGVWYRQFVKETADSLEISGTVQNLADGRVEVCAALDKERYLVFKKELQRGSLMARVDEIVEEEIDAVFDSGFNIIR